MSFMRKRLYEIIFESDTKAGRAFDTTLLCVILISVVVVMLESIGVIREKYYEPLKIIEWSITGIFTIEYLLRIWVIDRPIKYMLSFYGVVDLLTLLPSYLGLFFAGSESLIVIRMLRILRVFRILKLGQYTQAGRLIASALWSSKEKISVFILFVFTITVILGTLMYLIEGEENGFSDIPTSIYWAIVTITTVGYGDLSPVTGLGKFFASLVMILGYSIIAVPTGIVTATLLGKITQNTQVCSRCMYDQHDDDAVYCKRCGNSLDKAA
jgi:voltage-gated potassium channel